MNGPRYSLRRADNHAYSTDDAGSGAEGPARKVGRFQRTGAENEPPGKRKSSGAVLTKNPGPNAPSFANRRRSMIRDQKLPMGPRPLESGKRIASETMPPPPLSAPHPTSSNLANSISEPLLTARSATGAPQISPTKELERKSPLMSYEDIMNFLPEVNFDDFQTSLELRDPQTGELRKGGKSPAAPRKENQRQGSAAGRSDTSGEAGGVAVPPAPPATETAQHRRSTSLLRRLSTSKKSPKQPERSKVPSLPPTLPPPNLPPPFTTPLPLRARRETQAPSAPRVAEPSPARQARKSIGPGVISTPLTIPTTPSLPTSANTARSHSLVRTLSAGKSGSSQPSPQIETTRGNSLDVRSSNRNMKAKSLLSPAKSQDSPLQLSPTSTDGSQPLSARSPGRPPGSSKGNSASKRQSIANGRASGLGARTISPTDARRLKRLSLAQTDIMTQLDVAPPMPLTPSAIHLEFPVELITGKRSLDASPVPMARNSVTPASARATPDHGLRKSSATRISLSSSPSLNSLRDLAKASASKLPTPKPRNVQSSAGSREEEVPPVPAIPKAFESPSETMDQPFFTFEGQAIAAQRFDSVFMQSSSQNGGSGAGDPPKKASNQTRHRRGLTVGTSPDTAKPNQTQANNRKNMQPLMLPPLNLLPLSTPTTEKIAAFGNRDSDRQYANAATPPPKRNMAKTPSTPMTASKATFQTRQARQANDDTAFPTLVRSNSTHYQLRSDPQMFEDAFQSPPLYTPSGPLFTDGSHRGNTTPFASSSLPKNSGEFDRLAMAESTRTSEARKTADSSVTGQNSTTSSVHEHAPHNKLRKQRTSPRTSTDEPSTPGSGTSLRRKLSARFKRSSSKNANHPANEEAASGTNSKTSDMPPPRLPASATWNSRIGTTTTSPSPAQSARPSKDFSRRKSSIPDTPALSTASSRAEPPPLSAPPVAIPVAVPVAVPVAAPVPAPPVAHADGLPSNPRPVTIAAAVTPRPAPRSNSATPRELRRVDSAGSDRDEVAADEEMKILCSKRRDFESAARELDELRRRARPKEKVSPVQALNLVNLNIFERGEIIDYRDIYFCGTKTAKKHIGDLGSDSANFGYDDDRGDYNIVMGDHLAYRYEVVDVLGKGSFGQVVRCVDHKTGLLVAVKIIRNKKRFHQQALVEVNILQKLREWDPQNKHSMINFTHSFYFRGHLCICAELLGMNLYEFIKAHDFKGFSLRLIRRFTKQMLSALVLLKHHRVIHCDLKPENILLKHPLKSEIKMIDFGSSCFDNEKVYTYIQSRFYRSPEVILGMSYGLPIDMWSLGCILAELFTGYPIFPGENEQEQLACIMEIFGPPEKHLIEKSSRKKLFFDSLGKPRVTVSSKGRRRRPSSKTLQQALKCDDDAFLDFIARCLRWDPERRLKPDEAMNHPFVTGSRKGAPTRVLSQPVTNGLGINGAVRSASGSSPVKRNTALQYNSSRAPARPLPEPPTTSFKVGIANGASSREVSPSKIGSISTGNRRHSTINTAQGVMAGTKRTSNGSAIAGPGPYAHSSTTPLGSALPRATTQRTVSGRSEIFANSAAAASLRQR